MTRRIYSSWFYHCDVLRYTDPSGHKLEVITTTAIGCQINSSREPDADPLELSGMGDFVIDETR